MLHSSSRMAKIARIALPAVLAWVSLFCVHSSFAISDGDGAPDIKLTDGSGKPVSLASLKGKVRAR